MKVAQAVPLKGCAWFPLTILFLAMFGPFEGALLTDSNYMGAFVWMLSPGQTAHDSQ